MSTWESLAGWGVPELPWLPGAKQGAFPCVPLRDLRPSLHLCSLHGLTPRSSCLSSFPREGPHRPCPLGPLATGPVSTIADPSRTATASPRALPGPTAWQVPCLQMDPDGMLSGGCFGGLVCPVARAAGSPCAPGLDLLASLSLWEWPSQGEGALCRAGPVPYSSGPRTPGTRSGPGTVLRKFSVNE